MRKGHFYLLVCGIAALAAGGLYRARSEGAVAIGEYTAVNRPPRIRPDYTESVIPPNIAPLNFVVEEEGTLYCVRISSTAGESIEVVSRTPGVVIPVKPWKKLMNANRGRALVFDIYVRAADGRWRRFDTVRNKIARHEIDPFLVYRRIDLVYEYWHRMALVQRNLENYRESVVLDNRSFDNQCMNCHTFLNNGTDKMAIQLRGGKKYGVGMLLIEDGVVTKRDTRTKYDSRAAAFSSWHPSGKLIAFSVNKIRQVFHTARPEIRDGRDFGSDLRIYWPDSNTVTTTPKISKPDRMETWPAWSPDGRYLYFCDAPLFDEQKLGYENVRYDLMRIGYDLTTKTWGEVEPVLSAAETGLSISEPRLSPDGKFLLFCMTKYGSFITYDPTSDLYMMDVETGRYWPLEASNSDCTDSWHCWSSNGRWIVFTSRRPEGVFARAYFSYVDEKGQAYKPFLLPQKDPAFYDSYLRVFNVPELITKPVPVMGEDIGRKIRSDAWIRTELPVTSATPEARGAWRAVPADERPGGPAWRRRRE